MKYDFDKPCERRGTNSVKWDECTSADMLPLWVADMDFETAPCVKDAIVRRAQHGCYGYTLVPDAYYDAICGWFERRHQWTIEKDQVLYTIGVIPAIAAILKAWCQVGDNVVLLTPVYNCFFNLVRNAGCQAVEVPLEVQEVSKVSGVQVLTYSIDYEALERALSLEKTTVLLFCNPHNPAGKVWSQDELERVVRLCYKHGVLLISDEIHNELTAPDLLYTPMGRVVQQMAAQYAFPKPMPYCVCTSPSKSFNIAGLQNANIICPDAELRRRIDRAINLNETCDVNPFGIEAVIAAYTEGEEWLDALRTYIYDNYAFACEYLSKHLPDAAIAQMRGTYLMWVDVSRCMKAHDPEIATVDDLCRQLMIDQKLWLCSGTMYGKAGEGFVRINLACTRQTLTQALDRLVGFFTPKA